jgi:hypothetical protein
MPAGARAPPRALPAAAGAAPRSGGGGGGKPTLVLDIMVCLWAAALPPVARTCAHGHDALALRRRGAPAGAGRRLSRAAAAASRRPAPSTHPRRPRLSPPPPPPPPPTGPAASRQDTIVADPFFEHMPAFFSLSFQDLLAAKHPTAWLEFERDEISEAQLFDKFFRDGRGFDGPGLVKHMVGRALGRAQTGRGPGAGRGPGVREPGAGAGPQRSGAGPAASARPRRCQPPPNPKPTRQPPNPTPPRAPRRPAQIDHYAYVDGMQPLLGRLAAAGYPMHAMSNYPVWWRHIEAKLGVGRYLEWTFVSCEGPMRVGVDVDS